MFTPELLFALLLALALLVSGTPSAPRNATRSEERVQK